MHSGKHCVGHSNHHSLAPCRSYTLITHSSFSHYILLRTVVCSTQPLTFFLSFTSSITQNPLATGGEKNTACIKTTAYLLYRLSFTATADVWRPTKTVRLKENNCLWFGPNINIVKIMTEKLMCWYLQSIKIYSKSNIKNSVIRQWGIPVHRPLSGLMTWTLKELL